MITPPAQAQELAPYFQPTGHGSLLAYAAVPIPADRTPMQVTIDPGNAGPAERLQIEDETQSWDFFQRRAPKSDSGADTEFVLLQTKMRSRFAYDSWAAVQAGYGQFFPDDKIGRSRIDGVGMQDRDWLYLRFRFTF